MEEIYNWGMYPKIKAELHAFQRIEKAQKLINEAQHFIARGNGKCYGDSALCKTILSTLSYNKIINFDEEKGRICCESGVLLDDILQVIVPKGFFLPVTPGTKFISIGGAVAANIHGKNHHKEGALSNYIQSFTILTDTSEVLNCSATANSALFYNTIGGMGLTGVILEVTIQLKKIESSYINQKSIKARNLDEILSLFEQYNGYTYSVAWIDCLAKGKNLGRSILMLGEHSKLADLDEQQKRNPLDVHSQKQISIPFNLPAFVLNKFSVRAFNTLYYNKQWRKEKDNIIHYNPYFYPLDALSKWNRLYGKDGFTQYQFVLPFDNGKEGLQTILSKIAAAGCGSFLAVLKTFGKTDNKCSPISFPMPGYTLALDFKINKKVFNLLEELDKIVIEYGGRLYLAKDVRMSKETFHQTYKEKWIHPSRFCSLQSERLEI